MGDDGDRNQSPFRGNDGGGGGGGDDEDGDRNPPPSPFRGSGGGGDGDRNPSNTVAYAQTVAKRRLGHGQSGKQIKVATNHFVVTIPEAIIHHYDGMSLTSITAHSLTPFSRSRLVHSSLIARISCTHIICPQ